MARELSPHELHELLGAYALDAVDGDEREQLEAWLERSPEAREELAGLRETAAFLSHAGSEAPPGLWARIEDALGEEPPALVLPFRRRTFALRLTAGIAAASVAAATVTVVVLSDKIQRQDDRLEAVASSMERDGTRRAALAAMADPRSRTMHLESPNASPNASPNDGGGGGATATLVSMHDGAGYLMSADLPRLPNDQTYQLWAMSGPNDAPTMVSAGVLGRDFDLAAFRAPTDAWGFAITAEAASGVVRPQGPHVLEGAFA
ncbi:MAG: hypothetical protein EXQ79_01185 [Acidimicrobiia bacterium]|nr:hypothetical protein [Acidimicrobiia bacterium]